MGNQQKDNDLINEILQAQKDPEFIRAAYEFIRHHTGKSRSQ